MRTGLLIFTSCVLPASPLVSTHQPQTFPRGKQGQWRSQPLRGISFGHGSNLALLKADLCQVEPSPLNAFSVLVPTRLLN